MGRRADEVGEGRVIAESRRRSNGNLSAGATKSGRARRGGEAQCGATHRRRVTAAAPSQFGGRREVRHPSGEGDWIINDPEIDFNEIYSRFDTLLIGRKTFDAMLKMGGGEGEWPGMKSFVISRTMKEGEHPRITIARDAAGLVKKLKGQPGKDIWLCGGGELFRSLLDAGFVDGIDVGIIPVLLGGGVPLSGSAGAAHKADASKPARV
jgi:dihydrofolate reductase